MKNVSANQKGEGRYHVLLIGFAVVLIIFGIKYYNDHQDDIVIHPPHIDVH